VRRRPARPPARLIVLFRIDPARDGEPQPISRRREDVHGWT
jgi:hypothetical protein